MNLVIFIARGLMSIFFIATGLEKILNWEENVNDLSMAFSKWKLFLEGIGIATTLPYLFISYVPFVLSIVIFLELLGGLLLFIGFRVRIAAFLLLLFLIPYTLLYHSFWFEIGDIRHQEIEMFLKNLSLTGALLYLLIRPESKKLC